MLTSHRRFVDDIPTIFRVGAIGFLTVLALVGHAAILEAADSVPIVKKPSANDLKQFVTQQFASQGGYREGDLVTREATEAMLKKLAEKGWQVENEDELLEQILPANDFLVKQLSDAKGRAFLRKIQSLPGGIDRLDRLARMPQGRNNVNDLIRKIPNGAEVVEAMATSKEGRRLGVALSKTRSGKNFNETTGKIYQLPELVKEMHERLQPVQK